MSVQVKSGHHAIGTTVTITAIAITATITITVACIGTIIATGDLSASASPARGETALEVTMLHSMEGATPEPLGCPQKLRFYELGELFLKNMPAAAVKLVMIAEVLGEFKPKNKRPAIAPSRDFRVRLAMPAKDASAQGYS